ncbi:hypothetical protein MAR_012308 [Mya arenaria]|uniref:mRNA-decapping enzyme C-terminal domain-containing protein n=1 Tax=Mya arenaria TaxID=6604 RepID=A0ABY7FZL9_MYAAR|nr:hypothetical protein MAR_012308 [Mya arenaria]
MMAAGGSGVDIMQMLSKAQKEYDTSSKKIEPKPMIDNPNASATKTSTGLIRPQPLKIPDRDTSQSDEGLGSVTPGTSAISLEVLFRTVSLQQGTGTQKQPSTSQPSAQMDSYFSGAQGKSLQRSISMTSQSTASTEATEQQPSAPQGNLPQLLKHIMSSGSMVEEIERLQRSGVSSQGSTSCSTSDPSKDVPCIPDVSQPPPNHPAYRGASPQAPGRPLGKKPPIDDRGGARKKEQTEKHKGPTNPQMEIAGPGSGPNVLVSLFKTTPPVSSQADRSTLHLASTSSAKISPETVGARVSPISPARGKSDYGSRGEGDYGSRDRLESTLARSPLLTPADLLQTSAPVVPATTTVSSSYPQDKSILSALSAAATSLGTELLSPMAFLTSSRKTPPVTSSKGEKWAVPVDGMDRGQETDTLPVAALTREQLQQALNDSSFIATIHEAYLKSLRELSKKTFGMNCAIEMNKINLFDLIDVVEKCFFKNIDKLFLPCP